MRLLLDTQVYLWWMADDHRLGRASRQAIAYPGNTVHVSPISISEMSIKASTGRLDLGELDPVGALSGQGFVELAVSAKHAWRAGALPPHHKDPFDRMLVAQAELDNLTLVTSDKFLEAYGVPILAG